MHNSHYFSAVQRVVIPAFVPSCRSSCPPSMPTLPASCRAQPSSPVGCAARWGKCGDAGGQWRPTFSEEGDETRKCVTLTVCGLAQNGRQVRETGRPLCLYDPLFTHPCESLCPLLCLQVLCQQSHVCPHLGTF